MQKLQGLFIISVECAQRSVYAHGQACFQSIFDPCKSLFIAGSADQPVVYFGFSRVEGDLHAVKLCLAEFFTILRGETDPVGVETGDEPAGMADEFDQVLPHSGLASGKGHLRDTGIAADIQDPFPVGGGELFFIGKCLSCGVAVHALLVAVPAAVFGHGADHQVHPMGRLHEGCVISDAHEVYIRSHFFPIGDLADRRINGLQVAGDPLPGIERKDLLYIVCGAVQNTLNIRFSDLPAVIVVSHAYEFRQHDCPDEIYRKNVRAVDDGNTGVQSVFLRFRGDQVDADGAGTVGIQSRMQDFTEGKIHIGLQIFGRLGSAE